MTNRIWTFVGYKKIDKTKEGSPRYHDVVRIKVYDYLTETLAFKAAKKLVKRKGYYLEEVVEYHKDIDEIVELQKQALKKVVKMKLD